MAVYSSVLQLVAAVSSLTFVLVTGVEGLLGLGPAIFLVASGARGGARRAADGPHRAPAGRSPAATCCAAVGCSLTALATNIDSTPLVILGFALTGAANGTALLIRTAAGDMYPPARRARGISYVLFGSVFGAILGPAVFGPLFAGREVDAATLTVPWLVAAGISLVPLVLVWFVRPGPEGDRRAAGRARRTTGPPAARRAAGGDPAPPRRAARDAGRAGELRRDGLGDEPVRLRRGRAPPPRAVGHLPGDRRPRARHVRAGAVRRRADRPDRPRAGARRRAAA